MYVGRIVSIGNTQDNRLVALYRVSARSYPNREARMIRGAVAIVPKEGFESDIYKNPFIAYNGLRLARDCAVIGNGTHVDPIAERIESGMRVRDAMVAVFHGMDYEHDELDTPRIAGVVDRANRIGCLGIVRRDALLVREFELEKGTALYIATYEHNFPDEAFKDDDFHVANAEEACAYIIGKGVFAGLERPVSAACAIEDETGFSVALKNIEAG